MCIDVIISIWYGKISILYEKISILYEKYRYYMRKYWYDANNIDMMWKISICSLEQCHIVIVDSVQLWQLHNHINVIISIWHDHTRFMFTLRTFIQDWQQGSLFALFIYTKIRSYWYDHIDMIILIWHDHIDMITLIPVDSSNSHTRLKSGSYIYWIYISQ